MAKDVDIVVPIREQIRHFDKRLSLDMVHILVGLDDHSLNDDSIFLCDTKDGCKANVTAAFGGWDVTPHDDTIDSSSPRKKHAEIYSANAGDESINYVASNIKNAKAYGIHAKTADIDYSGAPIWKTCVEPKTYRYIPNNGKYRSSKAIVQKLGVQKPSKRFGDIKILNPEQKRLQKEIQRELRREFDRGETRERLGRSLTDKDNSSSDNSLDKTRSASSERGYRLEASETLHVSAPSEHIYNRKPNHEKRRADSSSPVVFPPIAVPLVTNNSQSLHTDRSSNNLDVFDEVNNKETTATNSKRSRPANKGHRSRSEPPHPASRTTRSNIETSYVNNFEIIPATLRGDSSLMTQSKGKKGAQSRGSTIQQQKRQSEKDTSLMNNHECAWSSTDDAKEHLRLFTEGSQMDMYNYTKHSNENIAKSSEVQTDLSSENHSKPRKCSHSSNRSSALSTVSSVPVMQIKYMAASGEVSKIPIFGKNSGERTSEDYYSSLEKESPDQNSKDMQQTDRDVKSTACNLHNIMTTRFITSKPTREIARGTFRAHNLKGTHLFTDSSSTKLVTGGFRAMPVGQLKLSDKKQSFQSSPKDLDVLPTISGRKVTMAKTSHRIV